MSVVHLTGSETKKGDRTREADGFERRRSKTWQQLINDQVSAWVLMWFFRKGLIEISTL